MSSSVWSVSAEGASTAPPDLMEVKRAISVLADPDAALEVRALPSKWSRFVIGDNVGASTEMVAELSGDRHVYYCLNPVSPNLGKAAADVDVLRRRWVMIDVDAVKPTKHKDDPSSGDEHLAAREVAFAVLDYLCGLGWPAPVVVDSGNGWQLLYRVDLPNDEITRAVLRRLLYALAKRFGGGGGQIDRGVHNAGRLARLPGTWNRKGQATPDRPWRMARLWSVPALLAAVGIEQLRAVADAKGDANPERHTKAEAAFLLRAGGPNGHAYGRAALDRECARVATALPGKGECGGRNNTLNRAAFSLGQLVAGGELFESEVSERLTDAARQSGLHDDPNCGERGIAATIRSGLDAGKQEPRKAPSKPDPVAASKTTAEQAAEKATAAGSLIIVRASEVTPKKVEWLWPGRIPMGKLTTFAGVGGLGKTFALLDITARVTQGMDWPDAPNDHGECGQVLFISGEDDPEDTLVPRLIECGADLERVAFLKADVQDNFTLAAVKVLTQALEQLGDDTRLVVIDPPSSYLGGVNDHNNGELRSLLSPLKSWAASKRTAMIFNTHLTKPQGQKVEAMMRVMGSVAWVNAVRAAHLFVRDPDDETGDRRLFVGMKNNLGKERKGLSYRIVETDTLARVEWIGEVDTTADKAVNREKKEGPVKEASEFLRELFRGKIEILSDVVWAAAKDAKISSHSLKKAKTELNIGASKRKVGDKDFWVWIWPDEEVIGQEDADT